LLLAACSRPSPGVVDGSPAAADRALEAVDSRLGEPPPRAEDARALDSTRPDALSFNTWAVALGGQSLDQARHVAIDKQGFLYLTGSFRGSAAFGTTKLTSKGWSDVFTTKLDPSSGGVIWVRAGGGGGEDHGHGVAVDSGGNVYVTGFFTQTASFDGTTIKSAGDSDIFVAKYSSAGALLWLIPAGGAEADQGERVIVDGNDEVYLCGTFRGSASLGPATLAVKSGYEAFAAKLGPDGTWRWATAPVGDGFDHGHGIAVDGGGAAYVIGTFHSQTRFAGKQLRASSQGLADVMVFKVSSDGEPLWAVSAGGPDFESGAAIAVDASGLVHIAGNFFGNASFGPFTLHAGSGPDIYAAALSPDGEFQWAVEGGGPKVLVATDLAVDSLGSSFVAGFFTGSAWFGPSHLVSKGLGDVFVARFSPAGVRASATAAGGAADDRGFGVAVDKSGHACVVGWFEGGPHAFGQAQLTSAGGTDAFVWRLLGP
jgi:hypothetical protein